MNVPGIPYVGFSNETLNKLPMVKPGDTFGDCPHCGDDHVVEGKEGDTLYFYTCRGELCLAALAGRLVAFQKPDVTGHVPSPTRKPDPPGM